MRYRWLLAVGACAATVWGIQGAGAEPADAVAIAHVAEFAGAQGGDDANAAQRRYVHSQPHHWRQLTIKNEPSKLVQ